MCECVCGSTSRVTSVGLGYSYGYGYFNAAPYPGHLNKQLGEPFSNLGCFAVAFRQLAPISFWRLLCSSFVLFFLLLLLLVLLLLALLMDLATCNRLLAGSLDLPPRCKLETGFILPKLSTYATRTGAASTVATIAATALQLVWLKSCLTVNPLPIPLPPSNKVSTLPIAHCS